MPEIRKGALDSLEDIQIGANQIEEVRLGPILVWRNNAIPVLNIISPEIGTDANTDITITSGINNVVTFGVADPDPLDTIATITVTDPTGADVAVSGFTPGSNSDMDIQFIIDGATLFANPDFDITDNNVFTITATDSRDGIGIATVTVTSATFAQPTVFVTSPIIAGGGTGTITWTVTQSASAIAAGAVIQSSTDGITFINGGPASQSRTVTCTSGDSSATSHIRSTVLATNISSTVVVSTGSVSAGSQPSFNIVQTSESHPTNTTLQGDWALTLTRSCSGVVGYPNPIFTNTVRTPGLRSVQGSFFFQGLFSQWTSSILGGSVTASSGSDSFLSFPNILLPGGTVVSPQLDLGVASITGPSPVPTPAAAGSTGAASVARGGTIVITFNITATGRFASDVESGSAIPEGVTLDSVTGTGTTSRVETFSVAADAPTGAVSQGSAAFVDYFNPVAARQAVLALDAHSYTIT